MFMFVYVCFYFLQFKIRRDASGLRRLSDCDAIRHADVVGLRRMSDCDAIRPPDCFFGASGTSSTIPPTSDASASVLCTPASASDCFFGAFSPSSTIPLASNAIAVFENTV